MLKSIKFVYPFDVIISNPLYTVSFIDLVLILYCNTNIGMLISYCINIQIHFDLFANHLKIIPLFNVHLGVLLVFDCFD